MAESRSPLLRATLWFVLGSLLLYAVAPAFLERARPPLIDNARILSSEIFSTIDRTRRIPKEVALPRVLRSGLSVFLAQLELEDDVRERVRARLDRKDFVDELVPFVLALKDMYLPSDAPVESFDTHLRRHYAPDNGIPGFEHSMFRWQNASDASSGGGLDLAMVARLVQLYDALYLKESGDSEFSCGTASRPVDAVADRIAPPLKAILTEIRAGMDESEIAHALDGILTEPERLQAISISMVEFIDLMVCKHYRMFQTQVTRELELDAWLRSELARPGGGRIWSWLVEANEARRYGVVIAVDGLQGHLMEALATNDSAGPFIQEIWKQHAAERVEDPRLQQQTAFLEAFADTGYRDDHYLDFFRKLYEASPAIARNGIATTPTISVRNLPVIKTGAPVAGQGATGVPNFHFVDRDFVLDGVQQGRAYYFFGNDALLLTRLTDASGMRSLFQRLPDRSSYSCTAQYDERAHAGIDPLLNLALGEALRDFGELLCFAELKRRATEAVRLRSLREELLALRDRLGIEAPWYDWYQQWDRRSALERAEQLIEQIATLEAAPFPELLVYYNPWPDHFAHFTGPFADEILAPSGELARLDYWLEALDEIYRDAGVHDRTLFGMAGDHGLSPVFRLVSPVQRVFDPLEARVPLNVIKISSDEGEGPKLTHRLKPPSMRGYDVVVASTAGGNLMLDLFIDQDERWAMQPVEADLRAWRPIALPPGEPGIDLIDALVDGLGDTLDYLAVRQRRTDGRSSGTAIYNATGSGFIQRDGTRIHYRFEGRDPLGLAELNRFQRRSNVERDAHLAALARCMAADLDDPGTWCETVAWRDLSVFTERPDSVVQLAHLYDLDRAGTINLFPSEGVAYNSIVPGRHAGESFHEKDAFVGLWGAPVERSDERLPVAMGGSIPMSIFEHLSRAPANEGADGWGYPSLWSTHGEDTGGSR